MPMRFMGVSLVGKSVLGITGLSSAVALFATEEVIPGWTDISAVAKVSVIATLFTILSGVISFVIYNLFAAMKQLQKDHVKEAAEIRAQNATETTNARTDMLNEIKDSRQDFGKVITEVRESFERQTDKTNDVLVGVQGALLTLSTGCAAVQARVLLEHEAIQARKEISIDASIARNTLGRERGEAK